MGTRDDTSNFCRGLALVLGLAGTLLAAMCLGAAAELAVGFGGAAALCFAWVLVLIGAARRLT
jgi:hypothetical protein